MIDRLQQLLIYILVPISKIANRIPEKIRTVGFYISFAGLISMQWFRSAGLLTMRYLYVFAVGCILLGILIFCSLPKEYKKLEVNRGLFLVVALLGVFVLISGCIVSVDRLPNAMLLLLIFPVIWFVWFNGNYALMLRRIINTTLIMFGVYFAISAIFFPALSWRQYSSFMNNVNMVTFYLITVVAATFIRLLCLTKQKGIKRVLFYVVVLGMALTLVLYTNSRTGQLTSICIILFGTILYLLKEKKQWKNVLLKFVLPLLVSIILFVPTTLHIINFIPSIVSKIINEQEKTDNDEGPSYDVSYKTYLQFNEHKLTAEVSDVNEYSSGRTIIWREYVKQLKLFGQDPSNKFFIPVRNTYNSTAHMTILQYAYDSGIFAGVLFLIFNIYAGILSIIFFFKEKDNEFGITTFVYTIGFGLISLLASVVSPFYYSITMYYFLCQGVLLFRKGQKEEER